MKIITDISVTSRPMRVGAQFNPLSLFRSGSDGCFHVSDGQSRVFSDTGGLIPAQIGESVARVNDMSSNSRHATQPSSALRPLLGRAPVSGRRNLLTWTGDIDAEWGRSSGTVVTKVTGGPVEEFFRVTTSGNGNAGQIWRGTGISSEKQTTRSLLLRSDTELYFGFRANQVWVSQQICTFDPASGSFTGLTSDTSHVAAHAVGDGFWRVEITHEKSVVSGFSSFVIGPSNNAASRVFDLAHPQVENGPNAIPYQRVGNALDVTEAGIRSPAFIRFDLSDDVLSVPLPVGGTFDVMVFGRKGSWIEPNLTISETGSLNIGPTTITHGPAGFLDALGDIVGWVAIDRPLVQSEIAHLQSFFMTRGSAPILESI